MVDVKAALKDEIQNLKMAPKSAENDLKVGEKAVERLSEKVTIIEKENHSLKSALKDTEKELNLVKI